MPDPNDDLDPLTLRRQELHERLNRQAAEERLQFFASRALILGGTACFTVAALGILALFVDLVKASLSGQAAPTTFLQLLVQQSLPLALIAISLMAAFTGYLLFRSAGRLTWHVIPAEDKELLTGLIQGEKEKGISLYVQLSSLTGATGVFQKLGLVGLPLTTVGLTVLFTLLSLSLSGRNKDYSEKLLDLAKLTLGAFIGSYVQKQATMESGVKPSAGLGKMLPAGPEKPPAGSEKPPAPEPDKPAPEPKKPPAP